jgi:hypothetical protein
MIFTSSLQDIKLLGDILSRYVLKGDVRGVVWTQGVQSGVYLELLYKLKELMGI